jgi:hypothetical protein
MNLMNLKSVFILFACIIVFGGCTKDDPIYHGKIRNAISQKVHIALYNTAEDYYANSNVVWSADIPAGQSVTVPASLEGGKNYYMDWYSEDYTSSNWPFNFTLNMANITPEQDPLLTIWENLNYSRIVCLSSNQASSHWKAVDAENFGTPVWSTLSENDRYRELVFRKDLTGVYSFKDQTGTLHNVNFTYSTSSGSGSPILNIFTFFQGSNTYVISTPFTQNGSLVSDTLEVQNNFPQMGNYQYTFAKQ